VRALLDALGLDVRDNSELRGTPERVAAAFCDEFLAGYRVDPAHVLRDTLASEARDLVTVTHLRYESMCPHHLMPAWGVAHVGYLPGGRIVGIGQLPRLIEACARRLVLQETLGRTIVDALVAHAGARAAGVVLDAAHACMCARGERQGDARVVTQSFAGLWHDDVAARAEFLYAVATARAP
jgi:GTP cyclohydrolase I